MSTVAILGTRYSDFSVEESILTPRGVTVTGGDGASSDAIAEQSAGAVVVLAGATPRFDSATIARLSCRGIVRYGVGLETIDLEAASRAGIWVAYVPDYGTEAVALHSVTLILASLRRLSVADSIVKAGRWSLRDLRPLHTPDALVIGIIGFGRVGQRVAEMLEPFGFDLAAYDAYIDVRDKGPSVRAVSLGDLLTTADVITLHAPGPSDGTPMIGASELECLKRGTILINTARGSLIDTDALTTGLKEGRPAFAALDVFAKEPPQERFVELSEQVLLTPHMAWYTEESELDLRMKAAHEALRIIDGQRPLNPAVRSLEET